LFGLLDLFIFLIWLSLSFLIWKLLKLFLKMFIKDQKKLSNLGLFFFAIILFIFFYDKISKEIKTNTDNQNFEILSSFKADIIDKWVELEFNSEIHKIPWEDLSDTEKEITKELLSFNYLDRPDSVIQCDSYGKYVCDEYKYYDLLENSEMNYKELKSLYDKKLSEINNKIIDIENFIKVYYEKRESLIANSGFENEHKYFHATKILGINNSKDYEKYIENINTKHRNSSFFSNLSCPYPEVYKFALYMDVNDLDDISIYNGGGYFECSDDYITDYGLMQKCYSTLEDGKKIRLWTGKIEENGPMRAYQIDIIHGELNDGEEIKLQDSFRSKFNLENESDFSCDGFSLYDGFRVELTTGEDISYSGGNYVFNGDFNKITMWDSGAYKDKIYEYANELYEKETQSEYENSSKFDGL